MAGMETSFGGEGARQMARGGEISRHISTSRGDLSIDCAPSFISAEAGTVRENRIDTATAGSS